MEGRCHRRAQLAPTNANEALLEAKNKWSYSTHRDVWLTVMINVPLLPLLIWWFYSVHLCLPAVSSITCPPCIERSTAQKGPDLLWGDETCGDHRGPKGLIFSTFTWDAIKDHTWVAQDHRTGEFSNKKRVPIEFNMQIAAWKNLFKDKTATCHLSPSTHGLLPGGKFGTWVWVDFEQIAGGTQLHHQHCKWSNGNKVLLARYTTHQCV